MSRTKEKLDIFSENLIAFETDPTGSSQTVHINVAQNTRKRVLSTQQQQEKKSHCLKYRNLKEH